MQQKLLTTIKIYPWLAGLTQGLIFYIIINTVWLTNIKGFDSMQVVFLGACVGLGARIFMEPVIRLTHRLGNTWSMRLGAITLFITSILLTFGQSYWVFIVAMIFQAMSIVFTAMQDALIQNDLNYLHRGSEYIKISSRAHRVYAIATLITALITGTLFAVSPSLPMILDVLVCGFCVVLSFFVIDVDDYTSARRESVSLDDNKKLTMPHPVKLSIILFVFCGLLYGSIDLGQNNTKLLLQYQLETQFSVDQVVDYLGWVWLISRVVRIAVDSLYPKIYQKLQYRIGVILSFGAASAIGLVLLGFFLPISFRSRAILISTGFVAFSSLRDPFHIFCQTIILRKIDKSERNNALAYVVVIQQAGRFFFSLAATAMLAILPIQYTIIMLAVIIVPTIVLGCRLNRLLLRSGAY